MNRILRLMIAGLVSLVASTNFTYAGDCATPDGRLDDFLIVHIAPGSSVDAFITVIQTDHGVVAVPSDSIPGRNIHLLEIALPKNWGPDEIDLFEETLETSYTSLLNWAEFLYVDETPEGTTGSTLVDGLATLNDFQDQYAFNTVNAAAAQTRSTGKGVVVAVLDTGLDLDHPHFSGRIAPGGWDFIDNDNSPEDIAVNADEDSDGQVDEMTGHGTFVAGLITIIAPEAKVLPIRVLDTEGHGDLWLLARGLYHAIDQGVEIVNISITSTYNSQAVEDALDEAVSHGIAVVAAAGNCNRSDPREFPAMNGDEVIGVAAVDDLDIRGSFSNFDDKLYLSAPGVSQIVGGEPVVDRSIISTIPDGDFGYWEGTSMAAPLVAGSAALVRSQYPNWPANAGTYFSLRTLIGLTAVNIDPLNPGYEGLLGLGRIDVGAAVDAGPIAPTLGDLNADGQIDTLDLLTLLGSWGLVHSSADLDGDGTVGILDMLLLLSAWS